jgi:hypothetical protein
MALLLKPLRLPACLQDFDYQVKPDRGAMRVLLPYDGQLVVR